MTILPRAFVFALLCAALTLTDGQLLADEAVVTQARELSTKYEGTVVWVSAVAKMQAGGRTGEQEIEAIGTVIDASGLVVVAEDAFNPYAKIVKQFSGSMAGGAASLRELKIDLTQVEIRLPDGTEIPAKVALKDPDLGLSFVMPDKPADESKPNPKLPHLELGETPTVQVLDELISLGRLGKSLDSQPTLTLGRITAIVKKPRELYCGSPGAEGAPVFTASGKLLGISITQSEGVNVVVPAGEVLGSAKQALSPEE